MSDTNVVCVQFQKQGKDVERVKQRLAEIANYVDKVGSSPLLHTAVINHKFKIEERPTGEMNVIPV